MNKKIIIEDITRMKNLFVYKPGKVISEQITKTPDQQDIIDKAKKTVATAPEVQAVQAPTVVPAATTPTVVPAATTPNVVPAATTPNVVPAATTPRNNPIAKTPIGLIQTKLKDVYKLNIGTSGVNKDGVDGKWGPLSQNAFNQAKAIKAKSTPAVALATDSVVTPSAANKPPPPINYKSNITTAQQDNLVAQGERYGPPK